MRFQSRRTHRPPLRPWLTAVAAGLALAAPLAGCGGGSDAPTSAAAAGAPQLDTIEPGVIKVAVESYMPYTGLQGGKLEGLDSDILDAIAAKLHLKVEPQLTDFTGMLGGVQSHRVDITIGGVAWSKDRQQQGLFTDPPYYSPPAMGVRSGKTYSTVADLQGQRLGTVTGYVWVKSIKAVPGAQLHAYPNANGVFDDLGAGRLDVGFLDPLLIVYEQRQRPDLKIQTQYLTPPSDADVKAHPDYQYFRPYMTGFYLPKQEPKLEAAISRGIRAMYASGEMTRLIRKWGGDPKQFLTPSPGMAATRRGIDRPADWNPPAAP